MNTENVNAAFPIHVEISHLPVWKHGSTLILKYIQNIHNLSIKSISDCKKMSGKKRKTNISVKNKQGKLNKYEK